MDEEELEQQLLGNTHYALHCGCLVTVWCWFPDNSRIVRLGVAAYDKCCSEVPVVGTCAMPMRLRAPTGWEWGTRGVGDWDWKAKQWNYAKNGQLVPVPKTSFQEAWDKALQVTYIPGVPRTRLVLSKGATHEIFRDGSIIQL